MSGVPEGGVDERAGRRMPGQAAQARSGSLRLTLAQAGPRVCVSALCTLRSALCMLDTRRAPLESLGGVHAGKLLAASSQAVEALLSHWISRPEAGLAHGVACFIPAFHF
jgi:hypothetical protein